MVDNSGFRVDRMHQSDVKLGGNVDRLVTILDYPWIAIWMSPRETIKKIVNRDPTHQVIMLGALAGAGARRRVCPRRCGAGAGLLCPAAGHAPRDHVPAALRARAVTSQSLGSGRTARPRSHLPIP